MIRPVKMEFIDRNNITESEWLMVLEQAFTEVIFKTCIGDCPDCSDEDKFREQAYQELMAGYEEIINKGMV